MSNLKHDGRTVDMRFEIQDDWSSHLPHQVVTPTAKGQFSFTHKSAGLPIFGSILIGDRRIELNPETSKAAIDFTVGYHDHQTNWNWASAAGKSDDGSQIGLNLVHPIHHPEYHENVLWINGQPILLGEAHFGYEDPSTHGKWKIETVAMSNWTFNHLVSVPKILTTVYCLLGSSSPLDYTAEL